MSTIIVEKKNWVQSLFGVAIYLGIGLLVYGLCYTWTLDWNDGWFYAAVILWPFVAIYHVLKWFLIAVAVCAVLYGIYAVLEHIRERSNSFLK